MVYKELLTLAVDDEAISIYKLLNHQNVEYRMLNSFDEEEFEVQIIGDVAMRR